MTLTLLTNAKVATMSANGTAYGLIDRGVIAIGGDKILWAGNETEIPEQYQQASRQDLQGRLVTPAPIDCHTHIVFGGNRAQEFERRLKGESYADIARSGGGILSTVAATGEASEASLLNNALPRVDALMAEGVCTLEIKSGYGLTIDAELTMLRVARRIAQERPITVKTSFLGAHCLPAHYKNCPDAYLDEVCLPALDRACEEGLVDAVDGFCETIAFSPQQIERVFKRAQQLDLPVKLHAEQITHSGGAELAARYQALSADHLEYLDDAGVQALAQAGTVAVLLPGAFYTLQETQKPPIDLFRQHDVSMAVATDCNPGSSPLSSILMAINMSCTLFGLTAEEALAGVTREAAKALGIIDAGVIAEGYRADLAIWDIEYPAELAYRLGFNPLHQRVFGGRL